MRVGRAARETKETSVRVQVELEGSGKADVKTGIGYLDHLVKTLATHSLMDIELVAKGDLPHHVSEDSSLALGDAIRAALGDGSGVVRFGFAIVPMDDALAQASIDLARRPFCSIDLKLDREEVDGMKREDINHLFRSLSTSLQATIHVNVLYGEDGHHKVEAAFKALALSLREAIRLDPRRRGAPSAKGSL